MLCHHGGMEKDRRPASRSERFWGGANARGIPLQAIVAAVAVVAATFLAGKLLYRLRDVVLLLLVAGFFAVLLNPLVTGRSTGSGVVVPRSLS
jgi:predicted PurR-regulated permease PerM